jgi:hypothetical protein
MRLHARIANASALAATALAACALTKLFDRFYAQAT